MPWGSALYVLSGQTITYLNGFKGETTEIKKTVMAILNETF